MQYDERGFITASDGTRLFYGVSGSGHGLVLLDGIGCDGWAWIHVQPHLALRHRVVHVHYRGHGRSGPVTNLDDTGVEVLADDVLRVMDATGLSRAVLVAHSMGTQVALEIYRRHPERVRALVLICGSYGRITHTFHGNDLLHRVLPTLIEKVRRYEPIVRALWGRLPPSLSYRVAGWLREIDGATLRAEDFRLYVQHLSDIDLDLYLTMLKKAGDHSADDLLPGIRVPTLVIAAERDTFTPRDVVKDMADRIPGAVYRELKQASHAAPSEQPRAINEHIDDFLARLT
ncbi:MAG TPA: alpha/beta hydrolase [Polyangiales bacterium]|nr:alpha/beta hydrolase [Polyangiales bacterium]